MDWRGEEIRNYLADRVDTLWRLLSDAASWVDAHKKECDWIHPDIRWVLDVPESEDEWAYRPG